MPNNSKSSHSISSKLLIDDFKPYRNAWDIVDDNKVKRGSGNMAQMNADYTLLLVLRGALTLVERKRLIGNVESLIATPGLLMRTPDNAYGYESFDNTIAVLSQSHWLGMTFAHDFLKYGRGGAVRVDTSDINKTKVFWAHFVFGLFKFFGATPVKWVYNNIKPGEFALSSFIGRSQDIICLAQFIAMHQRTVIVGDDIPPPWRRAWLIGTILLNAFFKMSDKDSTDKNWHIARTLDECAPKFSFPYVRAATEIWHKKFKKAWPGGIGQLRREHIEDKQHPMGNHGWGVH